MSQMYKNWQKDVRIIHDLQEIALEDRSEIGDKDGKKSKKKYARSPIAVTILLTIVGTLLTFFFPKGNVYSEVISSLGMELAEKNIPGVFCNTPGTKNDEEKADCLPFSVEGIALALILFCRR